MEPVDIEELKAWMGWTPEDEERLHQLYPHVEPELGEIIDHFYDAILHYPNARSVLMDDSQVNRLKRTLHQWVKEMLLGPYDAAYWERRRRIGWTHVRVGLPQRYVFAAMNLLREDLIRITWRVLPQGTAWDTCHALTRMTDLESAVMCSTYMDAHEHQQLRTLQDLIIRSMPVTLLCLDSQGRVTSATRPSARIFGDTAKIGHHFERFLPPELVEAADLPSQVGRALATGEEVSIPTAQFVEEGKTRSFRINLVPVNHEMARILLHVEEVSDTIDAEARARNAEHLARLGALAAHMAHEIRNPLAAISSTLQVIGGSLPADDRRRPILTKVEEQVRRLDRLVSDLLGYARPARPKLTHTSLQMLAAEAEELGGCEVRVEEHGSEDVLADPQLTVQILVNLLQNARDAAGPEGHIALHLGPGPVLSVLDDGPGIDPSIASALFSPFVTTKIRGTGLGLAISRKLAESMGATLTCEAGGLKGGRGPGTTFRLRFPPDV